MKLRKIKTKRKMVNSMACKPTATTKVVKKPVKKTNTKKK